MPRVMKNLSKPKLVIHGAFLAHTLSSGLKNNSFSNSSHDLKKQTSYSERHLGEKYHEALVFIIKQTFDVLCSVGARTAVLHGLRCLEDEPLFNAGTGASLQADGQVRMSAALMDSVTHNFAGVINIQAVKNPIMVANQLAKEKNTMLAGELASLYAQEQGFSDTAPLLPQPNHFFYELDNDGFFNKADKMGAVGVVALDADGMICAGSSSGGIGFPGSVSDSATVAGTYASSIAGVSCTGISEHIINHGVAVRIVTRVEEGMSLQQAVEKTLLEAKNHNYYYGIVSLDKKGDMMIGHSLDDNNYALIYAYYDGEVLKTYP
jgi:L-asparaginase